MKVFFFGNEYIWLTKGTGTQGAVKKHACLQQMPNANLATVAQSLEDMGETTGMRLLRSGNEHEWSLQSELNEKYFIKSTEAISPILLMLQEMRAVIFVMTHSPIGETWLTGGHGNYFGKFCAPPPPPPLSVVFGLSERSV